MDELDRIRRQNRILYIVLSLFGLIILIGLILIYFRKEPPIVHNYDGKNGTNGRDAQVDYATIYSLIDNRISVLPKPQNGEDSTIPGPKGDMGLPSVLPGPQGEKGDDSTVPGPKGDTGSPGQTPEFNCDAETHDYRWRYIGDEDWQVLQPNSKACTENI